MMNEQNEDGQDRLLHSSFIMIPYPKIFISAGEHSGDCYGAGLADALRRRAPDVRLSGLGGARMRAAGVRLPADTTAHAGMGVIYVLRHASDWARVYRRCVAEFNRERPDVFVPIDNPGFHLGKAGFRGLTGMAQDRRVPVCYYVSPQVWAWWPWRIRRVARLVDRMMTILPFEKELYDAEGTDCRYVGHPMLDYLTSHTADEAFLRALEQAEGPVIGLLPGSRLQEVRRTFGILVAAARIIRDALPQAAFHVAVASSDHGRAIRETLAMHGLSAQVHVGRTHEIMKAARLCLVVSGTATLETAFYRTPMVIVYRTSLWHRHIAPHFLNVKHIGLVNVVGGGEIVPEFLKFDDDPAPVAKAALKLLRNESEWEACRERLNTVVQQLGPPGSFDRAARAVLELVGR